MTLDGLPGPFNEVIVQESHTSNWGLVRSSFLASHPKEGIHWMLAWNPVDQPLA